MNQTRNSIPFSFPLSFLSLHASAAPLGRGCHPVIHYQLILHGGGGHAQSVTAQRTEAAAALVQILPHAIHHLTAMRPAAPPTTTVAPNVPANGDDAVVQQRAMQPLHSHHRRRLGLVDDEAKPARTPRRLVEAHDDVADVPTRREVVVQLRFRGVERQIANVDSGAVVELLLTADLELVVGEERPQQLVAVHVLHVRHGIDKIA